MIFFTSDMHYGHSNIIKYANRPFASVDEMDQAMEDRWRERVCPEDMVFVLGDVSFYKNQGRTVSLMKRLPGEKIIIWGNHDKHLEKNPEFRECFSASADLMEIHVTDDGYYDTKHRDGNQKIVLCHYALRVWNKSHFGAFHLFGHSHGTLKDDPGSLSLDVGVDCWEFAPVSYDQIKERMKMKSFVPIDHHDRYR